MYFYSHCLLFQVDRDIKIANAFLLRISILWLGMSFILLEFSFICVIHTFNEISSILEHILSI